MFWWIVLALVIAGIVPLALRRANERRRHQRVREERQAIRRQRLDDWEADIRRRSGRE
jgi:hypothetical protein